MKTETKTATGNQAETQIIRRKANPEKTNKKETNNGGWINTGFTINPYLPEALKGWIDL